jgi:hypothetical protein
MRAGQAASAWLPPINPSQMVCYLDFNGSFGAVSLKISQRKRDEAYSFLEQYVRMGVPIVKTENS